MGGLLGRAKALFRPPGEQAPPPAAPVALRCVCGAKAEGLRRRTPQILACHDCGASLFVFPVDPLPPLVGKAKKPKPAVRPSPAAASAGSAGPAGPELNFPDEHAERPAARRGRPAIMERTWVEPEPPAPRAPLVSRRTVAILGLLAGLALLGGFGWRRQRIAALARDLPENARRGLAALQRGEFAEARSALEPAVAALDYGTPFPEAAAVRQGRDEAAALVDLLAEPLDEVLAAALAAPDEFGRRLAGRSVLVAMPIAIDAAGRRTVDWTELAGGQTVQIDLAAVVALAPLPAEGNALRLFAVRFAALEKTEAGWRLRAAAEGGALLTEPRSLIPLGLETDAKAAAALAVQRQIAGLPPLEAAKP